VVLIAALVTRSLEPGPVDLWRGGTSFVAGSVARECIGSRQEHDR